MNELAYSTAQHVLDETANTWIDTPLQSIFSLIRNPTPSKEPSPPPYYMAAQRLSLNKEVLFPQSAQKYAQRSTLKALHNDYQQARQQIEVTDDVQIKVEQTLALLKDYTWSVSSSEEAVSLYDAARTNAAIAAARSGESEQILLLGGDVSGVQDFLYTIAADQATKNLRGRSVYLQLLTDAVAHWLLHETGMPLTNLLYSGGGRFYLIVPAQFDTRLAYWRQTLGKFLLNVHQGELYIALGSKNFSVTQNNDFADLWRGVNEKTNDDKRRRFAELEPADLAAIFAPRGHGGNTDSGCEVCGYLGQSDEFIDQDTEETHLRCKLCASFEEMGRKLNGACFICIQPHEPTLRGRGRIAYHQVLCELGYSVWIEDERGTRERLQQRPNLRVSAMQDSNLNSWRQDFPRAVFSLRPIVNVVPVYTATDFKDERVHSETQGQKLGDVKSFGAMTKQARGVERWGVLRMDVDDLGDIFAYGLAGASLARISALSATLSRFFEGWVGEICRDINAKHGGRLYSVYSGGDDLFLVGSWDILPAVARQISDDLAAYTGNNPAIHISGGLSLHHNKYPLYQAADDARKALDQAKGIKGKNAFAFLEQTVQWQNAPALWELVHQLDGFISGDTPRLSRAILQTLQQLYSQYIDGAKKHRNKQGEPQWFLGPWVWRSAYQLTRLEERYKGADNADIREFITCLRTTLTTGATEPAWTGGRVIERAGFAARWVQILNRSSKEDRNDQD